MKVIRSIRQMQRLSRQLIASGSRTGLVPTMGFLHEGHLSLIRKARRISDTVIVSIFVNPTQFAPNEDFDKYPRDEKGDRRKAAEAGADIVFVPKPEQMYPDDFQTYVTVEKLSAMLEGTIRPTHFRGVTTVVTKLFNIITPDIAVFGMKDYQQAVIIRRMVRDLGFSTKIVVAPTVRESDGLALSSRNKYLDDPGRWEAVGLYYALRTAREMVRGGIRDVQRIRREMLAVILATSATADIEYIAFTDFESLQPVRKVIANTVCSLAVRIHGVRLIDNMRLA